MSTGPPSAVYRPPRAAIALASEASSSVTLFVPARRDGRSVETIALSQKSFSPASAPPPPSRVLDRFSVRRVLGRGAVGIVYLAHDEKEQRLVALKTIVGLGADKILALKKEFRAVRDVRHRNLVRYYDLFERDGRWYLTMEYVEGTDLRSFVHPSHAWQAERRTFEGAGELLENAEGRLRASLSQLAAGVSALHAQGIVHRDIKPANIIVERATGRVVLLDFGLATAWARDSGGEGMVGTVAYMAPEQAEGAPIAPGVDWYAVGVMLFELLTGTLPFPGSTPRVLEDKLLRPAPLVSRYAPDAPADLVELCRGLLATDPADRIALSDLRADRGPRFDDEEIVGRQAELERLDRLFVEGIEAARPRFALLSGESGVGKSALARGFVRRAARHQPNLVVFSGKCFEREAVPYKAFDAILDALGEYLVQLPEAERRRVLPPDAALLGQIFQGLHIATADVDGAVSVENPQQRRLRAFVALRRLVAAMARSTPLLLVIDDLQWADDDSLLLLDELVQGSDEPCPLMLLGTCRVGTQRTSRHLGHSKPHDEIEVGAMPLEEARALARRHFKGDHVPLDVVDAIVRDAAGHPMFIDELARARDREGAHVVRLDDALWARVELLPSSARRFLELVAVAEVPLAIDAAAHASVMQPGDVRETVAALEQEHLVRTSGTRLAHVECYHDRIRECVLERLAPLELRGWHGRIASALEMQATPDAEALARHWEGAGNRERAAGYLRAAADDAAATLAFARAALLYQRCVEGYEWSSGDRAALRGRWIDALANAGRAAEAADLLAADADQEKDDRVRQQGRRRAAELYLCSGHYTRGIALLRQGLEEVGEHYPASPVVLLVLLLWGRFVLRLRGMVPHERVDEVGPGMLDRIDMLASAGAGFAMCDSMRGAYFQSKNLKLALDAGDPTRLVRTLQMETCFVSAGGVPSERRARALLSALRAQAGRAPSEEGDARIALAEGYCEYMVGKWAAARAALERAERLFRDRVVGHAYFLGSSRFMLLRALVFLGDIEGLSQRLPPLLRAAEEQRDRYSAINFRSIPASFAAMGRGQRDEAWDHIEEAERLLVPDTYLLQNYFCLAARCQLHLYEGNARAAREVLEAQRRPLKRSLVLRVQTIRAVFLEL
jgi:hypothetical protein